MTDEEYSRIVYALWQAAQESSQRADALQSEISAASTALRNTAIKLPDELKKALQKELPSAADNAAKTIASRWTEANTHAEQAAAAYKDATVQARKTILIPAAILLGIFTIGLIVFGILLFKRVDELAYLHAEKARLETTIQKLARGGGYANVRQCTDAAQRPRLCVRIDEAVKVSDKRWRVIKGY